MGLLPEKYVFILRHQHATHIARLHAGASGASSALAVSAAQDIQDLYNSAGGKITVNGASYTVKFEVRGHALESKGITGEFRTAGKIFTNSDPRNNFFRVENQTSSSGGESFSRRSGNDGMLNYSEISKRGSTTEAHEIGHGLGLRHNNESDYSSLIKGKPDLMDNRNDRVQEKYRSKYALPDGSLNLDKREVSQKNIDDIFTPDVINSLEKNGKAAIGTTTNTYYAPNGQGFNKK